MKFFQEMFAVNDSENGVCLLGQGAVGCLTWSQPGKKLPVDFHG